MEYFLKDSYHTLLWRLESAFSPVIALKLKKKRKLVPSLLLAPRPVPSRFPKPWGSIEHQILQFCTV